MRRSTTHRSLHHIVRGLQLFAHAFVACPTSLTGPQVQRADDGSSASSQMSDEYSAPQRLNSETVEVLSKFEKNGSSSAEGTSGSSRIKVQQVPSSRAGRAFVFGSLVVRLGWDKLTNTNPQGTIISREGHEQIAATLCRMRGAVLKLGQMLSIQDDKTVPAAVTQVFQRVRDSAFAMPQSQLEDVMVEAFGRNWNRSKSSEPASADGVVFEDFDLNARAAASIGQVHYATILDQHTANAPASLQDDNAERRATRLTEVAVKVQYPGVAASIDSDVANLRMLIALNLLPKGMFVNNILAELRQELSLECKYLVEAEKQERYRLLVASDQRLSQVFVVPKVHLGLCRDNILVTEYVRGVNIDIVADLSASSKSTSSSQPAAGAAASVPVIPQSVPVIPQAFKNHLAELLMRLTLTELFVWRFMQTDPNFSNFLFDPSTNKINLLDFGAAREYESSFVQDYLDVVAAAAQDDRVTIIDKSIKLGFLTGHESKEMLDAHCSSVIILGKPFKSRDSLFDFSSEHLPSQIQAHVPTMLRLRLKPPPTPIYSLHRRLSGTILLCTKFGAAIPSGKIFWEIHDSLKSQR